MRRILAHLRKRWWMYSPASAIIIAFLVLSYGNPQWNKLVYIHQAYIFPAKYMEGLLPVPGDYSDRWRRWHENGQLMSEEHYAHGSPHGEWKFWDASGALVSKGQYRNGVAWGGTFNQFYRHCSQGGYFVLREYKVGKEWNGWFLNSKPRPDGGHVYYAGCTYKDGQLVSGLIYHYAPNHEVIQTDEYSNGNLTRSIKGTPVP